MMGFIKKDLLLVKKNLKTLIVIAVLFIFMAIQNIFDLSVVLPVMGLMVFISTFSYDDYNGFNSYVVGMPNGRKNAVKGKYVSSIILGVILLILSVLIFYLAKTFNNEQISINDIRNIVITSYSSICIIIAFMYPIIYKFGATNGRIWIFIIVFLIFGVFALLSKFVNLNNVVNLFNQIEHCNTILIIIISFLILLLSYKISLHIYKNKEF